MMVPSNAAIAFPMFAASLHLAAALGRDEVVELLLDRGFSLAATHAGDEAGDYVGPPLIQETTPFHLAVEAGRNGVVDRFLERLDAHLAGESG